MPLTESHGPDLGLGTDAPRPRPFVSHHMTDLPRPTPGPAFMDRTAQHELARGSEPRRLSRVDALPDRRRAIWARADPEADGWPVPRESPFTGT
jgi:hypothetical protein